jgi:hypothetical protein
LITDAFADNARDWPLAPAADLWLRACVAEAAARIAPFAEFARVIHAGSAIRVVDIVDQVAVGRQHTSALEACGFRLSMTPFGLIAEHPTARFPRVRFGETDRLSLAIRVESIAACTRRWNPAAAREGVEGSPLRRARLWHAAEVEVWAVERHGYDGFEVPIPDPGQIAAAAQAEQAFRARPRVDGSITSRFDELDAIITRAVAALGSSWACALFLRAERDYWETRNTAGRIQKQRQDALGLGWANDDHHTYDCSREWFHRCISALEALGFVCRERFYAGAEAGWGSQILEHPVLRSVIFADIDLPEHELTEDFAHATLAPLPVLRRAGLWCALHGESMLEAGLNHLECMYDAAALSDQFAALGIRLMDPFTNTPHLYQALTVGEWWPVRPDRIDALREGNQISTAEAEAFASVGAVGSHFENLERNAGYKGFNQPGISSVLRIIDPRQQVVLSSRSSSDH